MMRCEEVQKELDAFLRNDINEPEKSEIQSHLDECQNCSEALRRLKGLSKVLQTWQGMGPSSTITDPRTGVKYTKTGTFTGKRDVITSLGIPYWLNLSPNDKFLLWYKLMIPLDDGEPFYLVDMFVLNSSWSPDRKKIVFRSREAIWVIPVSPETGRPTGPAKKLLDGEHAFFLCCCWSPDSERIVIERRGEESPGNICILSVKDGTLTQITDDPIRESCPVWSPDGKTIAYNRGDQLRVIPAEGGPSRMLIDKGRPLPIFWSPDSQWLVCSSHGLRFFRLADGREFVMKPPIEVAGLISWSPGGFISWSPDGKKIPFYRSSYDYKSSLKVVSASGGLSFELGRQLTLWPYRQYWSPDSKMIVTEGEDKNGERGLWIIPFVGGDPFLLELDVSVSGEPRPLYLSPDCKKLAFVVPQGDEKKDLYVVPVSLKDGRTTGSAAIVFSGWVPRYSDGREFSWSPDGTKIAVTHEGNIWMASAEGGEPVQVTVGKHPEHHWVAPGWSPDGKMIAYKVYHSEKEQIVRVIPASGSEDTIILDIPLASGSHGWSADSKDLVFSSEGVLSAISIVDGKSRQILDMKELSIDRNRAWDFSWSPDRQKLAFIGYTGGTGGDKDKYQIFIVPAEGGEFTELASDDPGEKYYLYWSPDGKWISYNSDGNIKTRPEGEIWEADVSELLSAAETEK